MSGANGQRVNVEPEPDKPPSVWDNPAPIRCPLDSWQSACRSEPSGAHRCGDVAGHDSPCRCEHCGDRGEVAPPLDLAVELPGWKILNDGAWLVAVDPAVDDTGLVVRAQRPDELLTRVRRLVAFLDLARGRLEGVERPETHPALRGQREAALAPPGPTPQARQAPPARSPPVALPAPTEPGPVVRTPETIRQAKELGYEGDQCPDCGAMRMVRNGVCLKCTACGATTGCS